MKLNANNRQRLLAILAGTAVLLLVLDRVLLTPLTKSWQSRSTEITKLTKNVTQGRSVIDRGPRTQSLWKEMEGQSLPKDPAQAEQELISAFDRWGRSSNIELGSIKPQWKRGTSDRYSLLECRVDATGSLATLMRFLYEVERSPLALRVESVELTTRDPQGQRLTLALLVSGLRLAPLERKS
ncbi:MAG: hypothetical protein Q7S40_19560 [Opitutaceae bacterium]|nr:hypothetical protein [Opitutaceae bacterium]